MSELIVGFVMGGLYVWFFLHKPDVKELEDQTNMRIAHDREHIFELQSYIHRELSVKVDE